MSFLITLGLVETLFDLVVDRVKRELVRATIIKKERVDDDLVVINEDMDDAVVRAGVNIGVGDGVDVCGSICGGGGGGGGVGVVGQSVGATSCRRSSSFLCEKCKKHDEDSIKYLQTLSHAMNEFKTRGGQGHSIKQYSGSIYSTRQEEKNIIYQGNT
ncbi:hypothetical protein H5410_051692 [Solanum commersonii]|uniref:Uncharacterized protein n=1 Tax=Solanum commersonii TaxID=4109 RepID=A0A9J5WYT9_SOLCO|nr:hypothetical protein H5410_051692 [Solanum commersonii]